jgi:hypothetical protein
MKKVNLKYGLIALAGLGISANAAALTCSDITFSPTAFAAYEFADKACLEMVERSDGNTYAKFTATKVAPPNVKAGVTTYLRFKHSDGTQGPRHKSNLPRTYQLMLSGQAVRLADIQEGQNINIYVPEEEWTRNAAAAPAPAAAPPPPPPPPPPPAPEPEPEPEPMALPTTAGPLPWLALFGSLFLILGGALRFSRKQ